MRPTNCGEILLRRGNYLVRRLPPGHATPWHRDPFHRVTVVLSGDMLHIEFQDGAETERSTITAGEGWSRATAFTAL